MAHALPISAPDVQGMSSRQLAHASALLAAEVSAGRVGAASMLVARNGHVVLHAGHGAPPDAVFLLASISKPVNAVALMLLVERGLVALDDPVSRYLPEFTGGDRERVRVRDLLTHTSGLPDMLPDNLALRRAHAPLGAFVQAACSTPLLFAPQTGFNYQSMGTLLAGEIVQRVSTLPLREFHRRAIFDPLGMRNSSLGLGGRPIADTVACQTDDNADMARFGPNSLYWRDMGHPWGGMHSTVTDLALLLQVFLDSGQSAGRPFLAPATVASMITDQNRSIGSPWGLGWGLATSPVWVYCGNRVSRRSFGHSGATGTVAWADPDTQLLAVILTTLPTARDGGRLLCDVSDAVVAAVQQ
jgi:CubicO group peptidase (beta-lactamase class C family)